MKVESRKRVILGWKGGKVGASPQRVLSYSLDFMGPDCWKPLKVSDQGSEQIRALGARAFC